MQTFKLTIHVHHSAAFAKTFFEVFMDVLSSDYIELVHKLEFIHGCAIAMNI